ncbi:2-C-methyl-D-erythritol 4-phosphate cytidylyltransferase [Bacillus piscicola]|uniref:2-C-methyl-D-erythritol 4-phosphate cytidylyltransferase n=1 Tax=Bacillus piscicola TaxID=1632684 RepID=UPI001F091B38|nr:2-C-methyl-D-erythritol 4-phosphate cytidylyltransferase [Bacillus piscicola]
MNYTVIIPAAGQGSRMKAGRNKQFLMIGQKPLIVRTVSLFANDPLCDQIVVAANQAEISDMTVLLKEWVKSGKVSITTGGDNRQSSVYAGLKQLRKETNLVLVHDGARPFVTRKEIRLLLETAVTEKAAVLGVRVKDTIKRASDGIIQETLDRSELWAVQTPQAFGYPILMEAYKQATAVSFNGTDDASLVERIGRKVHIVEGSYDNIKLTTPEDIVSAEAILRKRNGEK